MRDPRLTESNPAVAAAPLQQTRSQPSPNRSSAAATTYLTSRAQQQHQQASFLSQQPLQQLDRSRESRSSRQPASDIPPSQQWARAPNHWQEPPPPPAHRVYTLRCASCDTFLSDRGMRAVLLLKPNIILFSTDAFPCNSGILWPNGPEDLSAERTCDCLTSSIACHGCGSTVGYQIVQPCTRCTASVQRHQRSANHHRFVFHHDQVSYAERRCFGGEPGVVQTAPLRSSSPNPSTSSRSPSPVSARTPQDAQTETKDAPATSASLRVPSQATAEATRRSTPTPSSRREGLRHGDVVYWHNLVSGGEQAQPIDPLTRPRAISERVGR